MIEELRHHGQNFVIVTHEMGFARRACRKTAFLVSTTGRDPDSSNLIEYGDSDELFSNPQTPELKNFLAKILEW